MVRRDGTEVVSSGNRNPTPNSVRRHLRREIGNMSRALVRSGEIPEQPCLLCGSGEKITIHHLEPVRPDRFVFLCRPCHDLAHKRMHRWIRVPVVQGQFSIRPEAVARHRPAAGHV